MTDPNYEIGQEITTEAPAVITPDIPLGVGGGKILLSCETGVYQFIKTIAEDKNNGLPNQMTGVLMRYITNGIEKDFGRTWDRTPSSIRTSQQSTSSEQKKKAPSKKYKNELIARSHYDYYANDVENGTLTREEATTKMFAAIDEIKELEEDGFVISKNKTAGVKRFDAEAEVNKNYEDSKNHYLFYKFNDYEIVLPNLQEYGAERLNGKQKRTYETQLKKCGALQEALQSRKPFSTFINDTKDNALSEWEKDNNRIAIHILKSTIIGQQKPRYICYEGLNKKSKKQSLLVIDVSHGGDTGGLVRTIDE